MLKRNSFLAVGIAALALPCLSDAAMAKCQLKKEVLLEITSEIGGLAKDLFAAAADEEIDYFQASAAGVEHGAKIIDKLVSGPDFGEAFTQLDKDLKDIGSTLFDEIQNIGLFNEGYKSLDTAITAGQRAIKQGKLLPQFGDDDTASQDAVRSAYATDDMSKRAVNDCANDGGTHWTDIKALAKKAEEYKTNDTAWEWRRSVPYLMSAIPLRLGVIETMDPNWRTDRLFDKELYNSDLNNSDPTKRIPGHANGLEAMFNKMTGAVQCAAQSSPGGCGLLSCNPPTPYHVACADVSTGLSVEATRDRTATADQLNNLQAVFKSQLIEQMPLFEMRSMVDTLHFDVSHAADLTKTWKRIPVATAHNLCLDVQSGSPSSETPMVLGECKAGSAGQTWVYDRVSHEIYNPRLNTCLGVQRYPTNHAVAQPIPGTLVVSAACGQWVVMIDENEVVVPAGLCAGQEGDELEHCLRFQRWTYDPVTQVLSNAFGTVLDVKWGKLSAGTAVWIWERNDTPAQQWYADPKPCITCIQF